MTTDLATVDAALDELLIRWHAWRDEQEQMRRSGYRRQAAVIGEFYRSSRQHDRDTGVLDDDLEQERARLVDVAVHRLPRPGPTVLVVLARNLAVGVEVWSSPAMPQARHEREALIAAARGDLARLLRSSGVL